MFLGPQKLPRRGRVKNVLKPFWPASPVITKDLREPRSTYYSIVHSLCVVIFKGYGGRRSIIFQWRHTATKARWRQSWQVRSSITCIRRICLTQQQSEFWRNAAAWSPRGLTDTIPERWGDERRHKHVVLFVFHFIFLWGFLKIWRRGYF